MQWNVFFHARFEQEFEQMLEEVQDELLVKLKALRLFGPAQGRPDVDTLNDSRYANMKELRFRAGGGVWRVAFVFDPKRNAILLVAGNKSGSSERTFYKRLIEKADRRYQEHLDELQ